jgi:hypothetical protein
VLLSPLLQLIIKDKVKYPSGMSRAFKDFLQVRTARLRRPHRRRRPESVLAKDPRGYRPSVCCACHLSFRDVHIRTPD